MKGIKGICDCLEILAAVCYIYSSEGLAGRLAKKSAQAGGGYVYLKSLGKVPMIQGNVRLYLRSNQFFNYLIVEFDTGFIHLEWKIALGERTKGTQMRIQWALLPSFC